MSEKVDSLLADIREAFDSDGGRDALAKDLLALSAKVEDGFIGPGEDEASIDVRLRYHAGSMYLHTGDSSYDQDGRGYWAASSVGQNMTLGDCLSLADGLLEELLDDAAMSCPE